MTVGEAEAAAWALVGTAGVLCFDLLTQVIASRRQVNGRPLVTSERVVTSEDDGGAVQLTVAEVEAADDDVSS